MLLFISHSQIISADIHQIWVVEYNAVDHPGYGILIVSGFGVVDTNFLLVTLLEGSTDSTADWKTHYVKYNTNGEKELEIPKGTQSSDLFRFREEGIPSLRTGRRGDQIIQTVIKTPTNLNKKQEKLLREFEKLESGKLATKLKNILKSSSSKAAR